MRPFPFKGLGIIKRDIKDGVTYERINKQQLQKWLFSFGIINSEKEDLLEFIPENIFYKLCLKAENETAVAFQDVVTDTILPTIRKTGKYEVTQIPKLPADKTKRLEIQEKNARARIANAYIKIAANDALPKDYRGVFLAYASKELSGQDLLPLPKTEKKTYSATEIGKLFGLTANKISRLANKHKLKTDEYGQLYHDKSRHSAKEIDSFRYFDSVIPQFERIIGVKANRLANKYIILIPDAPTVRLFLFPPATRNGNGAGRGVGCYLSVTMLILVKLCRILILFVTYTLDTFYRYFIASTDFLSYNVNSK